MNQARVKRYVECLTKKYQELPTIAFQIGYPGNFKDQEINNQVKFDISKCHPFITNSGGSLNVKSIPWVSSMEVERDIILKVIAPWGGNEANSWAYITSGGTEGNFAGIQFGLKEFYPEKPVLVYSTDAHFSISKVIEVAKCQFSAILQIPTLLNGEIDCDQMAPAIKYVTGQNASPENISPVVLVATLGTTVKGACDDVCLMLKALYKLGLSREKIFVHLDAAFHGAFWHLDKQNPNYQFGSEFDSIAISGWKWHGADICGLYAVYKRNNSTYDKQGFREVLDVNDIGITSTRNGYNAISWMIRYLQFDWQEEYDNCQKNVKRILNLFQSLGIETFVNPASLTICTPLLPKTIINKFCLACYDDSPYLGKICHLVVCPHVTEKVIDIFFGDLRDCVAEMKKCFQVQAD